MKTSSLHIRLPRGLKRQAQRVIEASGLDVSSAIRLYFMHIITSRTIPLHFLTLNGVPVEFEQELKELIADEANIVGPFKTSKSLLKALYAD